MIQQDHRHSIRSIKADSPSERLARFAALQKRAFALLDASPEGYRRFWRRNLKKRAIDGSF